MSKLSGEFKKQIATYVLGGFSLVAGLAWNDAIKGLIDYLYPLQNDGLSAKFFYAVIITVLLVVVSINIARLNSNE